MFLWKNGESEKKSEAISTVPGGGGGITMETQLKHHLEKQSNKTQNIKHVNFVPKTSKESSSGYNQSCTKQTFLLPCECLSPENISIESNEKILWNFWIL